MSSQMNNPDAPGALLHAADSRPGLSERESIDLVVSNTGDRPVQVGSHFHFFEANRALDFKRESAYGMRLQIPAGTAVRFEPGQSQSVELIALGGERVVFGLNGLVNGPLDEAGMREKALERARDAGFKGA